MSASADLVLAIDCGTQSLRALAFDARGALVARRKVAYEPYFSSRPGWAEQDPELWWRSLVEACRGLVADLPGGAVVFAAGVAVLALSTLLIPWGMLARFVIARQPLSDYVTWAGVLAMG